MHPIVKNLFVDMRVYQPVTTSPYTADDTDCNSNNSETSSLEEPKYSAFIARSSYLLSKGLIKVGIMPKTGAPILYKSIKQD